MGKNLEKNIVLDYCYTFLNNLNMAGVIWVLYLAYRGMSLTQIGVLEGIFHVTSMLSEIPSGALADLLGRKKTILAGRFFFAASCLFMLLAEGFWGFAIGFLLQAWGYNFNSGSEEALLYDSMKQCGRETDYMKVNGRVNVLIEVAQSISTVAGGILAEYSFTACYLSAFLVVLLSIVPVIMMREPKREKTAGEGRHSIGKMVGEHFVTCGKILQKEKQIRNILLSFSAIFAVDATLFFYSQQYFYELGCNKIEISVIMLAAGGMACLGSVLSEKIYRRLKGNTVYTGAIVIAGGMMGFGMEQIYLSIGLFLAASFANAMLYPVQSASLNALLPAAQRATIISVDSMLYSVVMIILFPAAGACAEAAGLGTAFFMEGMAAAAVTIVLAARRWRKEKQMDSGQRL